MSEGQALQGISRLPRLAGRGLVLLYRYTLSPVIGPRPLTFISEAAAILRTPVATLRYWRHLGTGPRSFRVGRGVRYWRTEVHAWLEAQSNRPHVSR